jgi:hypothetical protein
VIPDRPRADEQPGGDLRVGQAVPGQPRHLSLLGRQRRPGPGRSWGGLDGPVGHGLTRVAQLTAGPLGERLDPDRLQHVVRRAKLLTRLVAAALAAQPLPVQQVSAGEHRTHAGLAQLGDRLAIQAVGDFALGQQRARPRLDPQPPVGAADPPGRPGSTPGSTPAVHSPAFRCPEKATKSNTTRQYERPGTAGSSSRRHRRIGIRGPAEAEPRVNRTQALRSAPATRLTTGHAHRAHTRFCPLPPSAELRAAMINTS